MVEQLLIRSLTCLYGFQDAFEMCYLEEEKEKKSCFQARDIFKKLKKGCMFYSI